MKVKFLKILLINLTVLVSLILSSCSNYNLDTEVKTNDLSNQLEKLQRDNIIDNAQAKEIELYIVDCRNKNIEIPKGKTYRNILIDVENWKRDKAQQEQKEKDIENQKQKEKDDYNKLITINLSGKRKSTGYPLQILMDFQFVNNSSKDIKAFQGFITFRDIFGDIVKTVQISYDKGIKFNEKKKITLATDYINEISKRNDDDKFLGAKVENIKVQWEPTKIIFDE